MDNKSWKRKRKRLLVAEVDMLNILRDLAQAPIRSVPVIPDLPADVEVLGVYVDAARMGFVFVLRHDSWQPVPAGEELPWLGGADQMWQRRRVQEVTGPQDQRGAEEKVMFISDEELFDRGVSEPMAVVRQLARKGELPADVRLRSAWRDEMRQGLELTLLHRYFKPAAAGGKDDNGDEKEDG